MDEESRPILDGWKDWTATYDGRRFEVVSAQPAEEDGGLNFADLILQYTTRQESGS